MLLVQRIRISKYAKIQFEKTLRQKQYMMVFQKTSSVSYWSRSSTKFELFNSKILFATIAKISFIPNIRPFGKPIKITYASRIFFTLKNNKQKSRISVDRKCEQYFLSALQMNKSKQILSRKFAKPEIRFSHSAISQTKTTKLT